MSIFGSKPRTDLQYDIQKINEGIVNEYGKIFIGKIEPNNGTPILVNDYHGITIMWDVFYRQPVVMLNGDQDVMIFAIGRINSRTNGITTQIDFTNNTHYYFSENGIDPNGWFMSTTSDMFITCGLCFGSTNVYCNFLGNSSGTYYKIHII